MHRKPLCGFLWQMAYQFDLNWSWQHVHLSEKAKNAVPWYDKL